MSKSSALRNRFILSLSISSVFLGFMLATQYRTTQLTNSRLSVVTGDKEVAALQQSVLTIQKKNTDLEQQVNGLTKELMGYEQTAGSQSQDLRKQLEKARIEAGTTGVVGAGISFSISDDPSLAQGGELNRDRYVHDQDVRLLITQLYLAGAEAVAINGQRVTYMSRIHCNGPTILVNNQKSTVPFKFEAIGDRATLSKSLSFPHGVLDAMKNQRGLKVTPVKEETKINIPPYTDSFNNIEDLGQKSKND